MPDEGTDATTDPTPGAERPARRRFGVVVLVGLAAAGAAALAGARAWVSIEPGGDGAADAAIATAVATARDASAPPVTATALVLLAAWGVLLVTRGRVRFGVAWLAVVAALGVLGFGIAAWVVAPDAVTRDLPTTGVATSHTGWAYLGLLAGAVGLATAVVAVRDVRGWPEMGRRYDAPAEAGASPTVGEDASNLELWKALDEGHDPTVDAPPAPRDDGDGRAR
ncbi:hypothetical protein GCM10023340_33900 [Nocardioides marinquilinus]|uniref:Trp biosynthesis protein n=1 Tax=Nocardioides marinquilinus TaxID=1210400 RepID=A0ABP9PYI6_9ACTN